MANWGFQGGTKSHKGAQKGPLGHPLGANAAQNHLGVIKITLRPFGAQRAKKVTQNGLTPIDRRSRGGQGEIKGASSAGHGPWGAPLIKDNR